MIATAVRGLLFCALGLLLGWGASRWWQNDTGLRRLPAVAAPPRTPLPAELLAHLPSGAPALREVLLGEGGGSLRLSSSGNQLVEWVEAPANSGLSGPLRLEYALDSDLTRKVLKIAKRRRVARGHIVVMEVETGRILTYVSTDAESFPPEGSYPAASLVKIVTAAAALDLKPSAARRPCVYRGNPYRLNRRRLKPVSSGNSMSLERSLATSNNQCFAKLAVNELGVAPLVSAMERFGWLDSPAPGHAAGSVDAGDDAYDLGRLGSGLGGSRITPLHAVQLAASLAHGERVTPWWLDRAIDGQGRELGMPPLVPNERVLTQALADELRGMLVRTTTRGTARSAFRTRRGRPRLGEVQVAGKTGNLSGRDPSGRYEWFVGVAPAAAPEVAVAVVQLHGHLWWAKSSEVAAEVLSAVFCDGRHCGAEEARRYTAALGSTVAPVFLTGNGRGRSASER